MTFGTATTPANVLIIDDDQGITESLAMLLEDEGYSVAIANNGFEGLNYLASHSLPKIILLDLMMPLMDGYTFRDEQVKDARFALIPVVIMTAGSLSDRTTSMNASSLVRKPIDIDHLLKSVQLHCA